MKVDHVKTTNEKLFEQAASILARTIPEQKVDAMKDYHKVVRVLRKADDWRIKPIIEKLELLYMYPGRKLHNSVVIEINDLLEETREKRINDMIDRQRALGDYGLIESDKLPWVIGGVLLLALFWR